MRNRSQLLQSPHEPQIRRIVRPSRRNAKVFQVGQQGAHFAVGHAEPFGQRGGVLVDGCAGQQAALADMPLVIGRRGVADADRWR